MNDMKILIVDDEDRIRKLLRDFLSIKGYECAEAADGEKALEIFFSDRSIGLIILDVMMPKLNGWEVLKTIRETSRIPVIMLTARGEEQDELHGFELGADEYISKPFSPKILTARVDAILRRSHNTDTDILECGGVRLNKSSHTVTADGEPVDLSFKEFELLEYFINNKNIALSRDNILNNVWDYDYFGDSRTIDTHVKKLRAKLGDCGNQIKTVWGMGYKFTEE
ncbi:MAG: response regulator transcription factor [Clostridiales bacterium]|nr:response regulator transcription factor [Clostridiales bacterium]